ncbi:MULTISPECIES: hypothetical protein [unclassified Cupriavidus]|uniref:hypothetical protein n=1 Tax=unclassified Cupriavidus TaxID=2640874 RepID=UPI00313B7D0C
MDTILIWLLATATVVLAAVYALRRIGGIGEGDAIEEPDYEAWRRETFDRWQDNRVRTLHARDAE